MRRISIAFLLGTWLIGAFAQRTQPQTGQGAISGIVIEEDTQRPLPNVEVRLTKLGTPYTPAQSGSVTMADDSGRFRFDRIGPGVYAVRVSFGAALADTGMQGAVSNSRVIRLGDGAGAIDSADFRLVLPRAAALIGRVFDESERPVAAARVTAITVTAHNGTVVSTPAGRGVVADDRGQFRLYGLPPGRYAVYVESPAAKVTFGASNLPRTESFRAPGSTYYPSADDPLHAQLLTLHPGEEAQLGTIVLARRKYREIILHADAGGCTGSGMIHLSGSNLVRPQPLSEQLETVARLSLPLGDYELRASCQGPAGQRLSGEVSFVLDEKLEEIPKLHLTVSPSVRLELLTDSELDRTPTILLSRRDAGFFGEANFAHATAKSGQFIFDSVPAGDYWLLMMNLPEPLWVTRVVQGKTDVTNQVLRVYPSGSEPLTVTLATGMASLRGQVRKGDDPIPGAVVVLMRTDATDGISLWEQDTLTDDAGHYSFPALPPGRYLAYAFPSFNRTFVTFQSDWNSQQFTGLSVDLRARESTVVDLSLSRFAY